MALKLPGILGKIISILGKIADIAIKGRQAGLWSETAGPNLKPFAAPQSFISESAETVQVSNGIPHTLALILTVAGWLLVTALQGLNPADLFSDPLKFKASFLAALWAAWNMYLQRPGQASVMLGSSHDLREEAKSVDSLKLAVPIRTDGGK